MSMFHCEESPGLLPNLNSEGLMPEHPRDGREKNIMKIMESPLAEVPDDLALTMQSLGSANSSRSKSMCVKGA
eukprot:CAMPEP_0197694898 /NCGR_PEP_ID=MMETSP1338-20131121/114467_1 /TAXON_ID=43686 ORGANISM="Pelagodinium beii, Strain RCC1491" /NCGR_SAMPLE_ID=MMETSP1338 /ASSEMBLY_ACC=CAM_ASM_000754 /LENGTH=72 /DNA_ID=CAMNT_0043277803 /DNA_START=130 /DNA_END=345 /DNA_ORIENTATION=+